MADVIAYPSACSQVAASPLEAGLPKNLAHSLSHELFQVLALLRGASDAVGSPEGVDLGGLTDPTSRAEALISMAEDKIAAVVRAMDPYI